MTTKRHKWKDEGLCVGYETSLFFEKYEEGSMEDKKNMDRFCLNCTVLKTCFAVGVSGKEYGLWGGVYLEEGEPSKEFNSHKNQDSWSEHWQALTMDNS